MEDLLGMIMWAITSPKVRGVYNATGPEPATNAAFTHELAHLVKRSVFLPAPELALKAALGSRATLILGSQKVFPRRAVTQGFGFKFSTVKEALRNLCGDDLERGISEILVKQWLPRPVAEIFPFFQNEKNLEILTPPFLNFHVVGKTTREIRKGTLIDYKLKLHGLPIRWRTEITSWQPPVKFVDNQIKGPYALWHHTHEFEDLAGGTLMTDRVQYRVPMGLLGKLTAGPFVGHDVAKIFQYRKEKARELFGGN
jgi:ligand-binding SRPBCC domain-containing protein